MTTESPTQHILTGIVAGLLSVGPAVTLTAQEPQMMEAPDYSGRLLFCIV